MQFDKTVALPADSDAVWEEVTDLAVLAACLPGARLESIDDDGRAHGLMGVRVGSMLANFEGVAEVVHRDDDARHLEVRASGAGSQGTADATIAARVVPDGDTSTLELQVAVDITGPLARLGQGMAQPVVDRLVDRFAVGLADHLAAGQPATAAAAPDHVTHAPPVATGAPGSADEPLDLGGLLLPGNLQRMVAIAAGALLALVALARLLRRPAVPPTVVVNIGGETISALARRDASGPDR